MTLITILGICATFFTILILFVHGTIIGYQTYKKQQAKKNAKKANLQQLLSDIMSTDENVAKEAQKKLQQALIASQIKGKGGVLDV